MTWRNLSSQNVKMYLNLILTILVKMAISRIFKSILLYKFGLNSDFLLSFDHLQHFRAKNVLRVLKLKLLSVRFYETQRIIWLGTEWESVSKNWFRCWRRTSSRTPSWSSSPTSRTLRAPCPSRRSTELSDSTN